MLPFSSGIPPSPPHTGQAPLSASGVPNWLNLCSFSRPLIWAMYHQPSAVHDPFDPPSCLDLFPLCPAFPDSLDGRNSVEYSWSAAPTCTLVICPPIPYGKPMWVPALLA